MRRQSITYSRALGAVRVWESFCLDSRYFPSRGCLELRRRTAGAIAGHTKEDLGESIRQDILIREDSVLGFVLLECSNRGKSFSLLFILKEAKI